MSALQWFVVIQAIIGILFTIAFIGKPKKPTTPGAAAVVVAIHLTVIALALTVWTP